MTTSVYEEKGAPRPEPAIPIDPRIRQRRQAVQRQDGRRRLRIVIGALGVVGLAVLAVGALYSPLLRVRHVAVSGEHRVSRAEILADSGLGRHRQMINVQPAVIASRLDRLPWVDSATVIRTWPGTVTIHVVERRAVAELALHPPSGTGARAGSSAGVARPAPALSSGTIPGPMALVDASGRVLALSPAPVAGLPTLFGLPGPGAPGTSLPVSGVSAAGSNAGGPRGAQSPYQGGPALALAAALPGDLAPRVGEIVLGPAGTLSAKLTPGPGASGPPLTVLFGAPTELPAKLTALSTVLAQLPLTRPTTIDLRVPDRPALTAGQSAASLSTTSRG